MKKPVSENVARRYDSPEGQLGTIIFDGHFHLGYWDSNNSKGSFASAANRLTQIMIDKTRIQKGQRFCDLGCGVGVPAMELSKAKECYVDGITVSKFQQEDATARASDAGLRDKTNFVVGNALNMPFADQSFDGGWFFESIFHMGHREALLEARRVLKPGATLVIADLTILPTATKEFVTFSRDNMFSDFISKEAYPDMLAATGFELVEIDDVSNHVMPQLVPKIKETINTYQKEILQLIGAQVIEETISSFDAMSQNLEYLLVSARKL